MPVLCLQFTPLLFIVASGRSRGPEAITDTRSESGGGSSNRDDGGRLTGGESLSPDVI